MVIYLKRNGKVYKVKVQVIQAKVLQRLFAGHLHMLWAVEGAPQFARDMEILTLHQTRVNAPLDAQSHLEKKVNMIIRRKPITAVSDNVQTSKEPGSGSGSTFATNRISTPFPGALEHLAL